jgi:hypothetical protein
VDVDEHAALNRLKQPRALDLARPEDHVAVGQDDRRPPGAKALDHIQRAWEQAVGERVVQVALLALGPERLREMSLQVSSDPIVVEQGVIDVEQESDRGRF